MNKQTPSKAEKEQERIDRLVREHRISQMMADKKRVEREGRIMRSVARKIAKKRVHKPKPVRRLKNSFAIVSIGGVNVEDENDFQEL